MPLMCTNCSTPTASTDVFCEVCGHDLHGTGLPLPPPVTTAVRARLTSAAPGGRCGNCGAVAAATDGYCDECGRRRGAGLDRADLELPGAAAVTDRGHHRHYNEDAVAIGTTSGRTAAVVCDGVSSSPRADTAAVAACEAALPLLLDGSPAEATRDAFDTALDAVAALVDTVPSDYPSCTYVSGVVAGDRFTVGWVGDSRAYWIPESGSPRCLTTDDAKQDAPGAPLTRWVGADALGVIVQIVTEQPTTAGTLLLCTDGLSRYLTDPAELRPFAGAAPTDAADRLVRLALAAGGADNIGVAVLTYPVHPGGDRA